MVETHELCIREQGQMAISIQDIPIPFDKKVPFPLCLLHEVNCI